jgi:hypothetical protein
MVVVLHRQGSEWLVVRRRILATLLTALVFPACCARGTMLRKKMTLVNKSGDINNNIMSSKKKAPAKRHGVKHE